MRKSIAAECPAGKVTRRPNPPRFRIESRVRLDPGTTVRVVVGRSQVNGMWVYDCVQEAAAARRVISISEHLLRNVD